MLVSKTHYNDSQHTDSNSLARAALTHPAIISPVLTHLGGKDDKRFPLQFLTEGVGNVKSINTQEYEYNVKTRVRRVRPVAETVAGAQGAGGNIFYVKFPDKWFIKQYVLRSQSGVFARIMEEPQAVGTDYVYALQLTDPDPTVTMPAADLVEGRLFAQMFAPVGVDYSRGNASNWSAPGKVRQKISTLRKSYQMSGNGRDWVMSISLPTDKGSTNLWMDYEEWQLMLQWKEECELFYWYGESSYDSSGATQLKELENGQPIVISPGLLQQITNKDTYSQLTHGKLKSLMRDVYFGMSDAQNKTITLMTGVGGMEEFDRAMQDELASKSASIVSDGLFTNGSGRNITLTGYFTEYHHIDGFTVRLVHNPVFDHGIVAEGGERHPITNLPLESYRMVFLDTATYDGEANVSMINKAGREFLRWAVAGSVVPRGFSGNDLRASDVDGASVHFLKQAGILLRRYDTSIDLQCIAA
jgi:hypothetical protein